MPRFTTACPRNCYSTCSLLVEVVGDRIRRIEAHPDNRATSSGPCLKGLAHIERVRAADRLLHPLRRRATGGFEQVSWPQALDLITDNLQRFHAESGPQSVLYYAASGTKGLLNQVALDFWRLYGGCTRTHGDLCWPAGLEATRLTLGDNLHNAPWDLVNARLIVVWGKNPAETNIHQMRFIAEAIERGGRLVVIDPRRTETAEAAEELVQPEPGSDGALALGIAGQLFRQGLVDEPFVERYVLGADELRQRVEEEYPPERVAALTGVPVPVIERLAEQIGTLAPVTICGGFGMQRYSNGGQTVRALIALLALTGNIGRPGAGWVYANLVSHIFSSPRDPLALLPEPKSGPIRSISTARLGEEMAALRDPALRMAWIERGNPVCQNPDSGRTLAAFRALDFCVVVDQVLTDTAREADLVLPAKTMFEQSDVLTAYWHPYVQLRQKLLDPPGQVKPESEVFFGLAERLYGAGGGEWREALPEPTDAAVERYLERRLAPFPELSLERLRQGPVVAPGAAEVAFANLQFPTPSGKIELLSREAAERWRVDQLPGHTALVESAGTSPRYPLHLLTPNTKDRIHSQLGNLPSISELSGRPQVSISPCDAVPRGIGDGDRVRVVNGRGAVEVEARLDHSLRPGCVAIDNGWWISQGAGVNLLSAARETDLGHGAAFHDTAVEVERLT